MFAFALAIWLLIIYQDVSLEEEQIDKLMGQNFKH
jgi:hypothetical protein